MKKTLLVVVGLLYLLWQSAYAQLPTASVEAPTPGATNLPATAQVVNALDTLGTQLFLQRLADSQTGSVLIAPVNLQLGLAQLALAAEAITATQFAKAWGLAESEASREFIERLATTAGKASQSTEPDTVVVQSAASLWVAPGLQPSETYVELLNASFGIQPQPVDFSNALASQTINAWIAQATQGLIANAVPQLPATTQLLLANAFYFRAPWQQPFDSAATVAGPFVSAEGRREVQFLSSTRSIPLAVMSGVRAVWLPFAGGEYSLAVILPDGDARAWAARSKVGDWQALKRSASYQRHTVELMLPRLELDLGQSMNSALVAAGLGLIFTDEARLDGLGVGVHLDEFSHRVSLRIDEAGAEAAASSAALALRSSGSSAMPTPFIVNRPYLLMLVHASTGMTLLQALVESP